MASKKKLKSHLQELETELKQMKSDLDASEGKVGRWKKKAKQHEESALSATKRVAELQRQRDKTSGAPTVSTKAPATAAPEPRTTPVPAAPNTAPAKTTATKTAGASTSPASTGTALTSRTPDSSWTTVELRQEARDRGLTGFSRKSKADLLDLLG